MGGLNFLTPDEIRAALAKMEPREPQHEPYMAAWWDEYICPVCTNNDISNPRVLALRIREGSNVHPPQ